MFTVFVTLLSLLLLFCFVFIGHMYIGILCYFVSVHLCKIIIIIIIIIIINEFYKTINEEVDDRI